jgi:FkbM family methyltransferase
MNRIGQVSRKLRKLYGQKRLFKAITAKLLFYSGLGRFFRFSVRNMRLRLFPSEMAREAWMRPASYRGEDGAFLKRVLKPGDLVVDVGANIGLITIEAGGLVGPAGRVISIEPNPRIGSYLKKNIHLNRLKNVMVLQTALGKEKGVARFWCARDDDRSHIVRKGGIAVPITTLDEVMQAEPGRPIDLLKIDVEGFEMAVLEGASQTLRRTRWLYLEINARNYAQFGYTVENVMRLLDSYGFETFVSGHDGNWAGTRGRIGPEADVNLIGRRPWELVLLGSPFPLPALSPRERAGVGKPDPRNAAGAQKQICARSRCKSNR